MKEFNIPHNDESVIEEPMLDLWRFYMKDIVSPDAFIDMGFYYMMAAALQRRVWIGSEDRALFPNLYVLLVGPPGVGKDQTLKPVVDFLKFHRKKDKDKEFGSLSPSLFGKNGKPTSLEEMLNDDKIDKAKLIEEAQRLQDEVDDQLDEQKLHEAKANKRVHDEFMIPFAPDSTTFEGLIDSMNLSVRTFSVNPLKYTKKNSMFLSSKHKYSYHSLAFVLDEAGTLFRKNAEAVVQFLVKAFDSKDYNHYTKSGGNEYVRGLCLNFMAGTVPVFMKEAFSDRLLNDGFASRTIAVYGQKPRFFRWDPSTLSQEQELAKVKILHHLFRLMKLFGECKETPEAREFGMYYGTNVFPKEIEECDEKLLPYKSRKIQHLKKLAITVHFSRDPNPDNLTITLQDYLRALQILNNLEPTMNKALVTKAKIPTGTLPDEIYDYLRQHGRRPRIEIWNKFRASAKEDDILEAIRLLVGINRIEEIQINHPKIKNRKLLTYEAREDHENK